MRRSIVSVAIVLLAACSGAVGPDDPYGDPDPTATTPPPTPTPTATLAPTALAINEVAAAGTPDDWFELYNAGSTTVTLSDYTFTDDIAGQPQRAHFPAGIDLQPGEYYVQYLNSTFPGFALASDEELGVYNATLTLLDAVDWADGESPSGGSYGRIPDTTGSFQTLTTPTPGTANVPN